MRCRSAPAGAHAVQWYPTGAAQTISRIAAETERWAAVHAAGPGSGLPVGARAADAGRYRTVAPLNLFRAEPGGTGRTRPPRRPGAGRRRRLGILRHRAARYAAAVNEQFRHARGAVNAAAMSGPAVVGRDALGLFQPRVVIGWWRRAVVPHPTPDAEARRGCPPNRTW